MSADGVLTLSVPLGREGANRTVRVIVETAEGAEPAMGQEEWERCVRGTAGQITDPTFDR
jgi:hypothetical protein